VEQPHPQSAGAQGAADKPTLAGTLEGTLKARLDENRQLLEISDAVLAAKLSGDALPRPQMQLKLAGFARAELDKQAVTLSNLVMGVDDALLSGSGSRSAGGRAQGGFDLKGRSWISTAGSVSRPRRRLRPPPRRCSAGRAPAQTTAPAAKALSTAEPDLTALKAVDLAGCNWAACGEGAGSERRRSATGPGRWPAHLKQFSAVAGGQVTASGVLDARQQPARYQVHKRVQGSMCGPCCRPWPRPTCWKARGIWRSGAGLGSSEQALRSRMQGGEPQAERRCPARHQPGGDDPRGAATLTGKGADQVKEVRKTDFSALTASFQIADGLPGATTSSCLPPPCG
jgi:AsmA protein